MVSDRNLKPIDDRPRPLWRIHLSDYDKNGCRMHDAPIEFFICAQVETCPLRCTQKLEQREREDYIRVQRLKTLTKIGQITKQNGNGNC